MMKHALLPRSILLMLTALLLGGINAHAQIRPFFKGLFHPKKAAGSVSSGHGLFRFSGLHKPAVTTPNLAPQVQRASFSLANQPEMTLVRTQYFVRNYGFFPRASIAGIEPADYTEAQRNEVQLRNRIDLFLQQSSAQDPLAQHLLTLQQRYTPLTSAGLTAQPQRPDPLRYGEVSWQENHQLISTQPEHVDDPLSFNTWYTNNSRAIMANVETTAAFDALRVAVRNGTPDDEIYRILDRLYHMDLGLKPDRTFVAVAYRGSTPASPVAEGFHPVIELDGIKKANATDAFILEAHLPHLRLSKNEDYVTGVVLKPGIKAQELDRMIRALTPPGFTVRMSPHEFGLQNDNPTYRTLKGFLHLHMEKIRPDGTDGPDISYVLNINAYELTDGKKSYEVWKIYTDLFRQYMDEYMTSFTLP